MNEKELKIQQELLKEILNIDFLDMYPSEEIIILERKIRNRFNTVTKKLNAIRREDTLDGQLEIN